MCQRVLEAMSLSPSPRQPGRVLFCCLLARPPGASQGAHGACFPPTQRGKDSAPQEQNAAPQAPQGLQGRQAAVGQPWHWLTPLLYLWSFWGDLCQSKTETGSHVHTLPTLKHIAHASSCESQTRGAGADPCPSPGILSSEPGQRPGTRSPDALGCGGLGHGGPRLCTGLLRVTLDII